MGMISRDPFARNELHKKKVDYRYLSDGTKAPQECYNCDGQDGKGNVHVFETHSDGGRKYEIKGKFCSVSCMRQYHGE